ncbi:protein prenyltransferase alpha subunit repeat containing protein 1, partial [Schistosoma japonicum]
SEYDIIPHVDGDSHKLLYVCEDSFGICNCITKFMFDKYEMELISNGTLTFLLSLDLLNCLLLIAPNTTTFWNYKRQALQNNKLSTSSELKFTQLILNKCPRSYETLFHRSQWIVQHYNYFNDDTFLQHELELCNKFADKYRCNYGLWQYRRFLLMHLHKRELYEMELNLIDIWLEKHPTDTSGWSYLERRLIILWLQLNQHRLPCSYIDESIIESLNPVEPLLYQALDIITKLKSSDNMYRINFSFNEFLNWAYKNKICHEPSTLKWIDLLSLRYLFWLSEYLTGSSKIE